MLALYPGCLRFFLFLNAICQVEIDKCLVWNACFGSFFLEVSDNRNDTIAPPLMSIIS